MVGWAMADHLRAELVVDTLQVACGGGGWRPEPFTTPTTAPQYTSWAFGHRLREAGLLGSMGSIGDCFDDGLAESFFATLQTELLDRHTWATANSWPTPSSPTSRGFHNPRRRHSAPDYLSRRLRDRLASTAAHLRSMITVPRPPTPSGEPGALQLRAEVSSPAPAR